VQSSWTFGDKFCGKKRKKIIKSCKQNKPKKSYNIKVLGDFFSLKSREVEMEMKRNVILISAPFFSMS